MAQVDTFAEARSYAAASVLHGAAADPTWGLLASQLRYTEMKRELLALRRAKLPAITWIEGYGDCTTYLAALAVGPTGALLRDPADATLPKVLLNHWGWGELPKIPPHRVVWMGPQSYFNEEAWARPWTRVHSRYGAPLPRYPDGRPATGYRGDRANPAHARLFDAGGAKDLNGRLRPVWSVNTAAITLLAPPNSPWREGAVRITVGLEEVDGPPPGSPGSAAWATHASIHKDAAAPFWLDYARASVRHLLDLGMNGVWCDNFSAWDNFGYPPLEKAFGDWSVARFRPEAARAGLTRPGVSYDIRADLKARFRRHFPGHDPDNLTDPAWHDRYWLDDPAWRAFRTFKRWVGAESLTSLSRIVHREARAAHRPDFALMGNDVPLYALGWVQPGVLDRVNTELTPGWHMGTGSAGTGLLPEGRLGPVYRLMTEHARSSYATAWLYLEGPYAPYRERTAVFRASAAEAMLGRTTLLGYASSGRAAGTPVEHARWNRFVRRATPAWAGRAPAPEAAILWSPASQLAFMTPGGYADMDAQPHPFGYFGWGTFFEEAHLPYRALPEFAVSAAALAQLRLIVLPRVTCMTDDMVKTLRRWVRRGGTLIVAGECGTRFGEDRAVARRPAPLFPIQGTQAETRVGKGRILTMREDPGMAYYLRRAERKSLYAGMAALLKGFVPTVRLVAPRTVGMSVYRGPGGEWQVDVATLDLDPARTTLRPAHDLRLSVPAPDGLRNWRVTALSSEESALRLKSSYMEGRITLRIPVLSGYATVRLTPKKPVRSVD